MFNTYVKFCYTSPASCVIFAAMIHYNVDKKTLRDIHYVPKVMLYLKCSRM